MVGALIGLAVASAAYSVYRAQKSDKQISQANALNRYAADLSYKSQQETNEMNYRIFQESQQYNSPANLKAMYDALGLNGSAIVANQGFTPTAAPQMVSPQLQQVAEMPFQQLENPMDKVMNGLISALSSEKMKAEIEKTIKERVLIEAQTDSCKASTENIIKDGILKDLEVKLTQNDVDNINETNAQLRLTTRMMENELEYQPKLQKAILRQYDDKHAIDVVDEICKKLECQYLEKSLKTRIASVFQAWQNSIKQGKALDLSNDAAEITNFILKETQNGEIDRRNADNRKVSETVESDISATRASNRRQKAEDNYKASQVEAYSKGVDGSIEDAQSAVNRVAWTYGIISDVLVSPLKGIIKFGR